MAAPDDSLFDLRLQQLTGALTDLVNLLRDNGEEYWTRWAERVLTELKNYDAGAFDQLLGAYGGVGSFNDLVLGTWSNQETADRDREINNQLDALRTQCYSLASDLRRDIRQP
jgi:hypothetical protein